MKILVLNREYYPLIGGGGRATRILVEKWVRLGFEVDIIVARLSNAAAHEVVNGVNVHRVWALSRRESMTLLGAIGYTVSALLKGIMLLRKHRYAAIHSGFLVPAGFVGALLSKLYHLPHETVPMGGDVYEPTKKLSPHRNFLFRWIVRWVINNSIVSTMSSDLEEKIRRFYSKNAPLHRIPLAFLEPRGIETKTDRAPHTAEGGTTILAVGSLFRRKNYDKMIEAIAVLGRADVALRIIGKDKSGEPIQQELQTLAREKGVSDRVVFLGDVSDEEKYREYSGADIFCMFATHDGTSLVCQEAMYFGLPIIASNTGGQTDFLVDGENAFLVNVHHPQEAAGAMERLIGDPALRLKFSSRVRVGIKEFFVDQIARRHLELMKIL